MSKSHLATLLAGGVCWFAVSCGTPALSKPPVASVGAAHPAGASVSSSSAKPAPTAAQPATPAVSLASTAATPTVAAVVSPWKDSGIFFYPLTLMAFAFGIAMYKSSGKSA